MPETSVPPELPPAAARGFWQYAGKPTPGTLALRTFVPWQILRFLHINLKMVAIIFRSHRSHPRP